MTSKKAKLLIAGAWILSFVICFPPLVGWNEEYEPLLDDAVGNVTSAHNPTITHLLNHTFGETVSPTSGTTVLPTTITSGGQRNSSLPTRQELEQEILDRCRPQCTLNQEPGYVIYSAVGSFYAPMLVMMFFNYKIYRWVPREMYGSISCNCFHYRTATKTTKAIRQGWTKVKGVSGEMESGMGIHRGGGASANRNSASANGSARGSGMTSTASSRRASSRRPSAYLANGITPKDAELVAAALAKKGQQQPPKPACTAAKPVTSSALPDKPKSEAGNGIPRSASSCLLQLPATARPRPPRSPSSGSNLRSAQHHHHNHNSSSNSDLNKARSKSMANVSFFRSTTNNSNSNGKTSNSVSNLRVPRVSVTSTG